MRITVLEKAVYYPEKLIPRIDEVERFAEELAAEHPNCTEIKIFANKRGDLMAKILGDSRRRAPILEMTAEREAAILESAIKKWGPEKQIVVAIEEMAELTRALTKYLRYGDNTAVMDNLKSEMADVSIMLNQLELIFGGCTEEEIYKLERLERRVKADD